jgi:thiol-disulfide isomerase/thioredoxin
MNAQLKTIVAWTLCCCLGFVSGCSPRATVSPDAGSSGNSTEKTNNPTTRSSVQSPSTTAAHHGVTFYTVDHYDESRDPTADLAKTMERANAEKKHILVQVGGDWCGWCRKMSEFIETDPAVRDLISENFVLMKVTYTNEQTNEAFLSKYPAIKGYPHLFVLDGDGKLLHSQDTAELEQGRGYNQAAYLKFLKAWLPGESAST